MTRRVQNDRLHSNAVALLIAGVLAAGAVHAVTRGTDDATIVHVLNRIGFGPRPGDIDAVRGIGIGTYIAQSPRVRLARREPIRTSTRRTAWRRPRRKGTADGWLNRYLPVREADQRSAFRAVSLTAQPAENAPGQPTGAGDALGGLAQFGTMKRTDPAHCRDEHSADYSRSPFGQALQQIAQLVKAGVGLEVAFAEVGGWDTHVNQGSSHAERQTTNAGTGGGKGPCSGLRAATLSPVQPPAPSQCYSSSHNA